MRYVDGLVLAVPTKNRQAFIDHARLVDAFFIECGALRVVENWGDDVPHGNTTDFYRAVQASEAESIAFAWIEWPDKATRDAAFARMNDDPRFAGGTVPFDGKRMIFGGFVPVYEVKA